MKDKQLTLGGLDRAKAWLEVALQALQGEIPKKVSDLTNDSNYVTAYDYIHSTNTTISGSTATVTFAANQRGSAMLTVSADIGLTIACNNGSDNYIWIKNTGSAEVDVMISGVTANSTAISNVYMPSDGITVPAGGLCEIGVIVNADGAFITSRNDLAL